MRSTYWIRERIAFAIVFFVNYGESIRQGSTIPSTDTAWKVRAIRTCCFSMPLQIDRGVQGSRSSRPMLSAYSFVFLVF